ncbi:prepilin peptidase dependent protein C [Klebsiella michiganensis]|uniref:Prepilin peptidase dependent protein C n=1 Tax=Klebsiella michiganensis TaxID=1134687 RepID=A0A7H4M6W0_9ENTR|nr:prepilin peptidase dependent protein C [Klebsiella michiganensis]
MPDALRRQRGFSLPETLLALVLLIATVTALAGYQRGLANGLCSSTSTVSCGAMRGDSVSLAHR